jgi:ATP-dependent DNA helicase RecG
MAKRKVACEATVPAPRTSVRQTGPDSVESDPALTVRLNKLPVTTLRGVGPRVAERLARVGLDSVQDLLFHLPHRYQDRTRICPIGTLRPGQSVGIVGEVELTQVQFGQRRSLVSVISDGTGRLWLRLFHFRATQQQTLARGTRVHCFGEVRRGPKGLEMVHPEFKALTNGQAVAVEEALTPYYPTTEGLHQLSLRNLTDQALELLGSTCHTLTELLPVSVLGELAFPSLNEALQTVHRPPPDCALASLENASHPAQRRLAFEELLAHHLSLKKRREALDALSAPQLGEPGAMTDAFLGSLPFNLTAAQSRVRGEITSDLCRSHPMHRLVQGDVGCGKTVVAALAALQAIESGHQVAFMAPTEILAEQHLRSFKEWFETLGISIGWLSGKLGSKRRRETLDALRSNELSMIIGTHALFQEGVEFHQLGLVVVDEQHRFGVHQRLSLLGKGQTGKLNAHQLIMTATPIPRTLAMTAYADLDTSVVDELPPGRKPIDTAAVSDARRSEVVERVHRACRDGAQAYWVCTLIDESEALQCQAATDASSELADALPDLRVGLIHGRMKSAEKDQAMTDFKSGVIDLLVATTVIEVGVDVPNASLMIIENAERLGLAQLHQLRGRVGRGSAKSVCVLMYHGPLSEIARTRLDALRQTSDGFEIARRDLEIRGPGELLGTRQTGMLAFRIADLVRDEAMFPDIETTAATLLESHTNNVSLLIERWLGDAINYADV